MQFGLFSHIPWPEGTEQRRIIEDITEEVQYGEELGFLEPGSPSTTFPPVPWGLIVDPAQ